MPPASGLRSAANSVYTGFDSGGSEMSDPINVLELEDLARQRLERAAFDYYASGAHDEITLRRNRSAFEELALHYRVLVDVAGVDVGTTLLGTPVALPIALAPTAFQRMACPDGELATARAAASAGALMTLSTLSTTSLEHVAATGAGPRWFQLYVYRDREATLELVARAEAAGYKALVLTVDAPLLGVRERDVRNGFSLPRGLTVANLTRAQMEKLPEVERESGLAAYFADLLDPALTWETVDWLAASTRLPVVVKGIVRPDDARRALDHGVSAVWVSNHGGRQLDTAPATIAVVAAIADAVGDRTEIYVDGGIRRGTDVLKALALGARAAFVGRPVLWGLAYDGEHGVRFVLETLQRELVLAMQLCGAPRLQDLGRWLVTAPS